MIKLRNTLVVNFTIIILLILVAGQGLLYVWFASYQRANYAHTLRDKMKTVAKLLAGSSADALKSGDYGYLDGYLKVLAADEDIIAVRIRDRNGKVVRETTLAEAPQETGHNPFYVPWTNVLSSDLRSGGETVGTAELVYSGRKVNESIASLFTVPPLVQAIVLLIVTCVIYFFFQRKVGRPVGKINDVLARITAGDLTVEVPVIEKRELNSIAEGLRFLVERLSTTIVRFNALSGNVATTMGQLTLTLNSVTDAAKKQTQAVKDVTASLRTADEVQARTAENSGKLSHAASENVSSLLEMKTAADEIATSTGRLFKSTADSYAMIAEMSQTSKAIAESSEEVSQAVETTSSSVEQISASLGSVRESTKKSSEVSAQVRILLTDRGTLAVADAISSMEEIEVEVNRSSAIITKLEERSKDIEKVLSVIREVTEKTNLLSLNAAILAAQAGEYGKGFSVVADEIRALSDRTSSSARDIATIVGTIQAEIHEAVGAIYAGVKKVEEGRELILKSGEAMGETLEAAQLSNQMAKSVEKATDEQMEGLRQIRMSMENMRLLIEQVAKATEEQRKGSSHMLDSISDVKEVAELVKKGTEEHVVGTRNISNNLELTLDMVSQINGSAQEQQRANRGISEAVEQMKNAGLSTMRDLEEVTRSFGTLREEIEVLKREMEVFRTSGTGSGRGISG